VSKNSINQMRWQPEIEWFGTRLHTDRLMFCNEAGQSVEVVGKSDWSVEDYLALVRKVGMTKAAQISEAGARQLMNGFTRDAIIAQRCASHVGTLATRSSDDLDFVEVPKWDLKEMLEAAYAQGWEDGIEDADEVKKACA
jgi:hypothetical protein